MLLFTTGSWSTMFIAALFIIRNNLVVSIKKWIQIMWYTHKMQYCWAVKKMSGKPGHKAWANTLCYNPTVQFCIQWFESIHPNWRSHSWISNVITEQSRFHSWYPTFSMVQLKLQGSVFHDGRQREYRTVVLSAGYKHKGGAFVTMECPYLRAESCVLVWILQDSTPETAFTAIGLPNSGQH